MAQRTQIIRQVDFSGGELRDGVKRRDDQPQVIAGARQLRNFRIRSSGTLVDRPGRAALFAQSGRTETILMPGDVRFRLTFGNNRIVIHNTANAQVASDIGYPWTLSTVQKVSFAVVNRDIVVCFPGMVPRVIRYAADGTWSFANWTFSTGAQNEIRAPFYRFPETYGISITPSARSGSITLTFSAAFLDAAHVGAVIRYKGYQIQIATVTNATTATATVLQELPPAQTLTLDAVAGFYVGQVVSGDQSNAVGEITAVNTGAKTLTVQLKSQYNGFGNGENIVGPTSRGKTTVAPTSATIQTTTDWDEQAISNRRGWPQACLYDRSRLEFFDLPALPEGILWSSINTYTDFLVGPDADNAIFELVPGRKHVLYMLGGPDQFVFTDSGVFFVPISAQLPLKPGNVQFVQLSSDGCGTVRPASTTEGIVFLNTGLKRAIAITLIGQATKPYQADDINELADHLLSAPISMAFSRGDSGFSERYLYVVNGDGTMAVARMSTNRQWVGWTMWSGAGLVRWASSLGTELIFNVEYSNGAVLVESLDDDARMDGVVLLNDIPSQLDPPGGGLGPLWFWREQSVDLLDDGRELGRRSVDTDGNIVLLPNDDFSSMTIQAGRAWEASLEPFVPHIQAGQDVDQTQRRRRIRQAMVSVIHSTGFTWGTRTIPSVFWSEEGGEPPTEREDTYRFRTLGRTMDPRIMLTKDRPGPIEILEVGMEVTI